jgi:hypothetical protein
MPISNLSAKCLFYPHYTDDDAICGTPGASAIVMSTPTSAAAAAISARAVVEPDIRLIPKTMPTPA